MKSMAISFMLLAAASSDSRSQIFENSEITNNTFVSSSFISDEEGWLADNNGKLWHTSDAGETWDSMFLENQFLKMHFTDALYGFALESDIAYKTFDGGHSWSPLILPGIIGKALYFLDYQTGFISGYQKYFRTTDGGASWLTVFTEYITFRDYCFINESHGFAVAKDDEFNRCIWKTADGGLTWENVFNERNYYMNSIWFVNENTGWAAGYYDRFGIREPAIIKTSDGGLIWHNIYRNTYVDSRGEALTDIRFKSELEGYAISRFAYDVYTTDGGTTWHLTHDTDNLGLSTLYGVYKTLDGYTNMYLIGREGTVTKWE
ncbi:MAG: hypothetical protein JST18_00390 [Bacteroidetes bacterium]|nr:hypothetical protein [Bacteroidota bacterium]